MVGHIFDLLKIIYIELCRRIFSVYHLKVQMDQLRGMVDHFSWRGGPKCVDEWTDLGGIFRSFNGNYVAPHTGCVD